jgi:hypothetical protein
MPKLIVSVPTRRTNRLVEIPTQEGFAMKLNEFSSADRPKIATFAELGDGYELTLAHEPEWVADSFNPDRKMLKIIGQDDHGVFWQINGRTQMPDAIVDAALAAGVEEIVPGGRLTVTWAESREKRKVYACAYAPPSDEKAPF